jgi:small subunit ribosomal protein S6e
LLNRPGQLWTTLLRLSYDQAQRLIKCVPFFLNSKLAHFKLVISDASGKSVSQELRDKAAQPLLGSRIGDTLDSTVIGLTQGKIRITGGSDKSGTPMRQDLHGGVKKYVLLSRGVGMQNAGEGTRIRKLVRGNTVTEEIFQLNCRLLEGSLQEKTSKTTPGGDESSVSSPSAQEETLVKKKS